MLLIEKKAWQDMIEDAEQSFPEECCGFFFGREDGARRIINQVLVVNNAKEGDKRRRFEIAPKDYLKAEAFAEEQGVQLLGVYHSHPNHPAIPSEHDRVSAQPWFSYVIISVKEGEAVEARSWVLNDQLRFEEEQISNSFTIQNINKWLQ